MKPSLPSFKLADCVLHTIPSLRRHRLWASWAANVVREWWKIWDKLLLMAIEVIRRNYKKINVEGQYVHAVCELRENWRKMFGKMRIKRQVSQLLLLLPTLVQVVDRILLKKRRIFYSAQRAIKWNLGGHMRLDYPQRLLICRIWRGFVALSWTIFR